MITKNRPPPKKTPLRAVETRDGVHDYDEKAGSGDPTAVIERMAGLGLSAIEIGYILGMPGKRVQNEFATAIDTGKAKAAFKVTNALFITATDRQHRGHVQAAIYWTQARLGWAATTPVATSENEDADSADAGHITDEAVHDRFEATMKVFRGGVA